MRRWRIRSQASASAFLDAECAGQPELRAAVDGLLAAHDQSGDFLLSPAAGSAVCAAEYPGEAISASAPVPETVNLGGSTGENDISVSASRTEEDAPGAPLLAAAVTESDVPHRVGRYAIRGLLGRGGMGAVYLAHDPELDRLVALKIPKLAGPDAEERFLREARAAAALTHPNLCPVFDVGRADGLLYLAMAYVPGPGLTKVLRNDGPLSIARCVAIAAGVAPAWPRPTGTASSTATSSRRTSCWTATVSRSSAISVWPSGRDRRRVRRTRRRSRLTSHA